MEKNDHEVAEMNLKGPAVRVSLPALELVIGLGCMVTVIFYLMNAYKLPVSLNAMDIGAGGFPKLLGFGTLLCLLPMIGIAVYHLFMGGQHFGIVSTKRPLGVLATIAVLFLETVFFEKIGIITCVWGASLLTMLACGERRVIHLLGVSVAIAAFIYVVFVVCLKVHFP